MQKLLSKMRQAINDFNLIENGDKILIKDFPQNLLI